MGRIVELCGEVAAEAEEGPEGLVLPPEAWERLRAEWQDEDIEDALALVQDSLMQSELVESADSLSARLVDVLGAFGETSAFRRAEAGQGALSVEVIGQLTRRVARLEEILEAFREGTPPDAHKQCRAPQSPAWTRTRRRPARCLHPAAFAARRPDGATPRRQASETTAPGARKIRPATAATGRDPAPVGVARRPADACARWSDTRSRQDR